MLTQALLLMLVLELAGVCVGTGASLVLQFIWFGG
jgi:hypothetical protein